MRYRAMAAIVAIISIIGGLPAAADVPALYTAAQADEGGYIFTHRCAECHGSQLEGLSPPPLKGPDFRRPGRVRDAQTLLTFISLYMPRGKPASLTPQEYSDIVAFILQQNGFPAGNSELSADTPGLKDLDLSQ
jgi:polar amino acid transport system substrate-binding protein